MKEANPYKYDPPAYLQQRLGGSPEIRALMEYERSSRSATPYVRRRWSAVVLALTLALALALALARGLTFALALALALAVRAVPVAVALIQSYLVCCLAVVLVVVLLSF